MTATREPISTVRFRRMLGDIEAGQVNCVVVKDLSRFGRDYIDVGRYLERWFPEHGVRFWPSTTGSTVRRALTTCCCRSKTSLTSNMPGTSPEK